MMNKTMELVEVEGNWDGKINLYYDEFDENQLDDLFDGEIGTLTEEIVSTSGFIKDMIRDAILDDFRSGILGYSGVMWDLDLNIEIEGKNVRFSELSEPSRDYIASELLEGYTSGNIIEKIEVEKSLDSIIKDATEKSINYGKEAINQAKNIQRQERP